MENINGNKTTIDKIEKIVKSNNGKYITISQYDEINSLMLSNKSDLLNNEENWQNLPSNLRELVEDSELYYGFNESEIKKFLNKVNKLGYTFNYVNVATQDNREFDHTFKPYALRKMDKGGEIKSKGTFHSLGTAKELGVTPKITGHDMIAKCDCGEKFSYQNSKKNILWQCPECNGMKRISETKMANGGMVLSNNEIMKDIDFEDNTDRRLGRYDFSFSTQDKQGAEMLDYDGYIIEAPSSSRRNDEIEWGQNTPEDWETAEQILLDAFYKWKRNKTS